MKREAFHTYVAAALLLYFAFFVIPPVSSFTATGQAFSLPDDRLSLAADHRQAKMYIVDIFLWLLLKQSRHSDVAIVSHEEVSAAQPLVQIDTLAALLPEPANSIFSTSRTLRHAISGHLSRVSDIYFARSGIAPPFLA